MEAPPHKLNVGRDEDRISALTDDLLLAILERLDLREAVRAGALSTRWRDLPYRLSRLRLDVGHFQGATPLEVMDAFTGAAQRLLSVVPLTEGERDNDAVIPIKVLVLNFYMLSPHLSSIGRTVEDAVSYGQTKCLEFCISAPPLNNTTTQRRTPLLAEFGQQFMSFSRSYPVAFLWLTRLTLKRLVFGHSDVTELISACGRLRHLTLRFCSLVDPHSALKIDVPRSGIQELEFMCCHCERIELISAPNLMIFRCRVGRYKSPPVQFGYVPHLCQVDLGYRARAWQGQFMLSDCFSASVTNLSKLYLRFSSRMIWIQPEDPKRLTVKFRNLTDVGLFGIFPECDLSWTLFILEAAPTLQNFELSRTLHSCGQKPEDSAEKTNVVWEPSKDLKHLNLKLLRMYGFEEVDKAADYIWLVMKRAVGLKRIELCGEDPCKECKAIDPRRSQVDEARRRLIKELLTHVSSSVEIIMC